jgi:hypothetical protein
MAHSCCQQLAVSRWFVAVEWLPHVVPPYMSASPLYGVCNRLCLFLVGLAQADWVLPVSIFEMFEIFEILWIMYNELGLRFVCFPAKRAGI